MSARARCGTVVGERLGPHHAGRAGFEGALGWLEAHLDEVLAGLPSPRDLSLLGVMLFCLGEHIAFPGTLRLAPYPALTAFARALRARIDGPATAYRFDA